MKKKIALLLSALMVVGMIPATAFAISTNEVNRIVTGSVDDEYSYEGNKHGDQQTSVAPIFKMSEKSLNEYTKATATDLTFKATLTNAEFKFYDTDDKKITSSSGTKTLLFDGATQVQMLAANMAIITTKVQVPNNGGDNYISFPIESVLKTEGDATISIDAMETVLSSGTYRFANVVSGSTSTTIEKTVDISEAGDKIKPIVITETSKGSMEWDANGKIKLKLSGDFTYDTSKTPVVSIYPKTVTTKNVTFDDNKEELYIELNNFDGTEVNGVKPAITATEAMTISISNVYVQYDEDDVKAGTVAEITVSGYDMTKKTLEVAVARDFGISFAAEDKTLPVFYSGRRDTDLDTLKVTMKETIADSWLYNRKTTITFPKGVKIINVDETIKAGGFTADFDVEDNELKITNVKLSGTNNKLSDKAKIEFKFQLSIAPDFTGDITPVLSGSGVETDVEATVGTAVAPITVEAESNPVSIDYRNVSIGDIVITEAYAGALKKNDVLALQLEDNYIAFDGTPKVEVLEGDIKIEDVDTDNGLLTIEIDSESSKTPAVLKVTGVELYLNRSIPAGSYALKLTAGDGAIENDKYGDGKNNVNPEKKSKNAFFKNSVAKGDKYKKTTLFDTRSVTVVDDYVEVVTAGRDQGDDTFTTKIAVTIGADKLVAGTTDIALDVPAYIANGYTMLPVRAITEALSSVAIVRWDDATRTVTITFGSRVVNMTVDSKTMNINGVPVQMQAACEITDSRAFIPLRDLGYALGLNDSKIGWDDATKTATLN